MEKDRRRGRGNRVSAHWLLEDSRRQGGSSNPEEKGSRGRTFRNRTVTQPKGGGSGGRDGPPCSRDSGTWAGLEAVLPGCRPRWEGETLDQSPNSLFLS